MTVRVRLQRFGRRNRPFYRVVVADSRSPRDGKFIELVGTYNPLPTRSGIKEVTFNVDRVRYWISVGAQPSDRVAWLLGQFGILPPKVVPVARTKQIMPRNERKELEKQQQAKGKGLHTSAACFSFSEASCYGGGGAGGESNKVLSPFALAGVGGGGQTSGRLPFGWRMALGAGAMSTPSSSGDRVSGSSTAFAAAASGNCVGCGSDVESFPARGNSGAAAADGGLAARVSRMSLGGNVEAGQCRPRDGQAPLPSAFSQLHAVLASHLALLGPSACSLIGLRAGGAEEGLGDAR